jgi:hypothetical protein
VLSLTRGGARQASTSSGLVGEVLKAPKIFRVARFWRFWRALIANPCPFHQVGELKSDKLVIQAR